MPSIWIISKFPSLSSFTFLFPKLLPIVRQFLISQFFLLLSSLSFRSFLIFPRWIHVLRFPSYFLSFDFSKHNRLHYFLVNSKGGEFISPRTKRRHRVTFTLFFPAKGNYIFLSSPAVSLVVVLYET